MGEQAISLRNVFSIQFQYKDTTTLFAQFFSEKIVRVLKILPLAYNFWLFWQLNANNWVMCWLSCNRKRFIVQTELYHVPHFICDHKHLMFGIFCYACFFPLIRFFSIFSSFNDNKFPSFFHTYIYSHFDKTRFPFQKHDLIHFTIQIHIYFHWINSPKHLNSK